VQEIEYGGTGNIGMTIEFALFKRLGRILGFLTGAHRPFSMGHGRAPATVPRLLERFKDWTKGDMQTNGYLSREYSGHICH